MRFKVKDVEYDLDQDRMAVAEARLLKKYTGMGILQLFGDGIKNGDPDALAGLVFLAKFRAGEQPKWRDLDDLDLLNDILFLDEDEDTEPADDDEDDEPDPT